MDLISQGLIQRVKVLAQRYYHPLPQLMGEVTTLESRVTKHLEKMGFSIDFDLLQN
jgi:type I restriction enzyme M protein